MELTLNSKNVDLILAIGEIVEGSSGKTTTVELEIPDQSFYLEITIKSKEAENDTEVLGCGGGVMEKVIYIPYLKDRPDGVMWKESDYHKQKNLEKKNPIFKRGGRK